LRYLILFFIIIPVVEIYLLIAVGREIGALFTISLVLLTAAVGLSLLRQQGLETFFRARNKIDTGELPAKEMIEALIILFSGALLLTPGFATDLFGFAGLVPRFRMYFVLSIASKFFNGGYGQKFTQEQEQEQEDNLGINNSDSEKNIIDAEYWSEEKDK